MFSSRGVQITTFDDSRNGLPPFDIPGFFKIVF